MSPAKATVAAPDAAPGAVRPVYLVKGDDPSLVAQAAHALCERLVAGGDPSLMVEEFGGPVADQLDVGAVIDACTTPPFLVERRVVVVREAGQLNAADAKRLTEYLGDPLDTTSLVLVGGAGTVPTGLAKAAG
jgi:DNA polymerase-3 subunit delta